MLNNICFESMSAARLSLYSTIVDQAFLIPQIPSGCTVPKPFPLATGRRIEERHRYDEELQRRQAAAEERDRELEEEREREEKQKLKEYRKTLVIKVGYGISCGHHLVGGGRGAFNTQGVRKDLCD